jgi:hypothetical protein
MIVGADPIPDEPSVNLRCPLCASPEIVILPSIVVNNVATHIVCADSAVQIARRESGLTGAQLRFACGEGHLFSYKFMSLNGSAVAIELGVDEPIMDVGIRMGTPM